MSKTINFKNVDELANSLGFSEQETEFLVLKSTAINRLDKEKNKRGMNNVEFATFLEIPKSRWSSILNNPQKVTVDYLIGLLVKCDIQVKLSLKKAA